MLKIWADGKDVVSKGVLRVKMGNGDGYCLCSS